MTSVAKGNEPQVSKIMLQTCSPDIDQRDAERDLGDPYIGRQQVSRETLLRRADLSFDQWYPTTISQTTIGRIVDLAQQWNVRVGNLNAPNSTRW